MRGLEGPIPVTQEQRDVVRSPDRHDQIQTAIAIEVTHRNGNGSIPDHEIPGFLEATVTVTQEHRDVVAIAVARSHVLDAISIEVAHGNGHRAPSCRESQWRDK